MSAITSLPEVQSMELRSAIGVGEYRTYTGKMMRCEKFFPAWIISEGHWLVQQALRGLRGAGLEPEVGAYRFCTNAAYSAGVAGVPTIGFGPGRESDAHVIDEQLPIESLVLAAKGYRGIIDAILCA